MLHTKTTTILLRRLHDHADQTVWDEFDARYRPILIGVAIRLGLSPEEASEAAQETLVQFLQDYRGHKYSTEHGRLRSWLIGICRHRVIDVLRRRHRKGRGDSIIANLPDEQAISITWDQEQQRQIYDQSLAKLRDGGRINEQTIEVFELVALKGVPALSVADTTGLDVSEVYRIKHRVTRRLREIVEEMTQAYQMQD